MQSSYQEACRLLSTSVQSIETSNLKPKQKNFRTYLTGEHTDELKASTELYQRIDDLTGKENSETFGACRTRAFFAVSFNTRKVRVVSNSCRLRWCPLCSDALNRYRTHSISDWVGNQDITRFLTLTLRHTAEDLSEQIKRLYYYFKQLRKIVYFKQVCTGGIWFFQVKRSKSTGEWHPHLHCLVTGSFIQHPRLSAIWESITGGSTVVDIRTIRDEIQIVKYVARYSSRPALLKDYNMKDRIEIFSVMHGKRLCGTWGTGRDCKLSPPKNTDLSEWRKIGSWETVNHHAPFLAYARIVFKCWKQNRAIPGYINLHCLESPEHSLSDEDIRNAIILHYSESDIE